MKAKHSCCVYLGDELARYAFGERKSGSNGSRGLVANQEKEYLFHSMSRSFCLEFLNALYHVTSRGGRRETFIKAM